MTIHITFTQLKIFLALVCSVFVNTFKALIFEEVREDLGPVLQYSFVKVSRNIVVI